MAIAFAIFLKKCNFWLVTSWYSLFDLSYEKFTFNWSKSSCWLYVYVFILIRFDIYTVNIYVSNFWNKYSLSHSPLFFPFQSTLLFWIKNFLKREVFNHWVVPKEKWYILLISICQKFKGTARNSLLFSMVRNIYEGAYE